MTSDNKLVHTRIHSPDDILLNSPDIGRTRKDWDSLSQLFPYKKSLMNKGKSFTSKPLLKWISTVRSCGKKATWKKLLCYSLLFYYCENDWRERWCRLHTPWHYKPVSKLIAVQAVLYQRYTILHISELQSHYTELKNMHSHLRPVSKFCPPNCPYCQIFASALLTVLQGG